MSVSCGLLERLDVSLTLLEDLESNVLEVLLVGGTLIALLELCMQSGESRQQRLIQVVRMR